jgi:PIN domain nuclease of toxin-antitoxin system
MNVLLDTHCWLWWIHCSSRLSDTARRVISDPRNSIEISVASIWEVSIKFSSGRLSLPESPEAFIPPRLVRDGFSPLAVSTRHALRVSSLPLHHRDPFDRLLIAQAQVEKLPILTADPQFLKYDVEIIQG